MQVFLFPFPKAIFRVTGQLWQVAHFKNNPKHGIWVRYDKNNNREYEETFDNGKAVS